MGAFFSRKKTHLRRSEGSPFKGSGPLYVEKIFFLKKHLFLRPINKYWRVPDLEFSEVGGSIFFTKMYFEVDFIYVF